MPSVGLHFFFTNVLVSIDNTRKKKLFSGILTCLFIFIRKLFYDIKQQQNCPNCDKSLQTTV